MQVSFHSRTDYDFFDRKMILLRSMSSCSSCNLYSINSTLRYLCPPLAPSPSAAQALAERDGDVLPTYEISAPNGSTEVSPQSAAYSSGLMKITPKDDCQPSPAPSILVCRETITEGDDFNEAVEDMVLFSQKADDEAAEMAAAEQASAAHSPEGRGTPDNTPPMPPLPPAMTSSSSQRRGCGRGLRSAMASAAAPPPLLRGTGKKRARRIPSKYASSSDEGSTAPVGVRPSSRGVGARSKRGESLKAVKGAISASGKATVAVRPARWGGDSGRAVVGRGQAISPAKVSPTKTLAELKAKGKKGGTTPASTRRTKSEKEKEKEQANYIAKRAAHLASQTFSNPEVAKQVSFFLARLQCIGRTALMF